MPFTNVFPRWENPGASPPEAKKDAGEGWAAEDRPPADWFNWYWSEVYAAGDETQDYIRDNLPKNNLTATTDPGVSNDQTEDYAPGSLWVNTTEKTAYVCTDASTGAAVWEVYTGLGGHLLEEASDVTPPHGMGAAAAEDYEEGTFTPVFVVSGNAPTTLTYSQQVGKFTKIGNRMFFSLFLATSEFVKGVAIGDVTIGGLPANIASGVGSCVIGRLFRWAGTNTHTWRASISDPTNEILIWKQDGNAVSAAYIKVTDVLESADANQNIIFISGQYDI